MVRDVFDAKEAAEMLGVHAESLRRWCRAGKVPGAVKMGSVWRLDQDALLALRKNGTGDRKTQ